MNIHEYQAKSLLKDYGVAVPRGGVAYTAKEAEDVAKQLGGAVWVVKSQIHAGGRGAGRFKQDPDGKGGVRVVKSIEDVHDNAKAMIGATLVTKQTGPDGKEVKRVYIEEGCDIRRELYLGMLVNRETSRIVVMASTEGGMEIEEVAAKTPEKIIKIDVDPLTGLRGYHARRLAFALGLEGKQVSSAVKFLTGMYRAFRELDASIVEVNPLVVTGEGEVMALDAKMNFDNNGLFRHPNIMELRDESEEDPAELEAAKHDLNYVKLDGSIGCMVNGAGLAMATMDIIKLYGSESRPTSWMSAAVRPVSGLPRRSSSSSADPAVEGILVNIFGGIMRCDVIARRCRRGSPRSAPACAAWWCAWKERTWISARRSWQTAVCPLFRPTTWPMLPKRL